MDTFTIKVMPDTDSPSPEFDGVKFHIFRKGDLTNSSYYSRMFGINIDEEGEDVFVTEEAIANRDAGLLYMVAKRNGKYTLAKGTVSPDACIVIDPAIAGDVKAAAVISFLDEYSQWEAGEVYTLAMHRICAGCGTMNTDYSTCVGGVYYSTMDEVAREIVKENVPNSSEFEIEFDWT